MSAKTDGFNHVHFDEENQPGISNLMSIMSKITGETLESIEKRYEGRGYGEFKREVAEVVAKLLTEIQDKYNKYNNEAVLNQILEDGAKRAEIVARDTLTRITQALGLK